MTRSAHGLRKPDFGHNQCRGCESCRQATIASLRGVWKAIRSPRVEWVCYAMVLVAVLAVVWGK